MTQEDKELLLKDLCARLDTNLVCSIYRTDDEGVGYRDEILHGYCKGDIWYEFYFREDCSIGIDNVSKIKPYLFPLSSITEMLEELNTIGFFKYCDTIANVSHLESKNGISEEIYTYIDIESISGLMNFFHSHHIDYRGLIEKGLAIDATGLNIY